MMVASDSFSLVASGDSWSLNASYASGVSQSHCLSKLPFGEELQAGTGGRTTPQSYSASDGNQKKWAQLERDSETNLDYAINRYYSSMQGRFMSVDPENAGAFADDPQSWPGYAYARNNPLLFTDPDGQKYRVCNSEGKNCVTYDDEEFYRIRRESQNAYGFTGSRDFYEGGAITQNGETMATYQQVSIDDPQRDFIFQMRRRSEAAEPLMKGMFAYLSIFTLPAGAAGRLTTLGLEVTEATVTTTATTASMVAPQAASALRNAISGFTKHGINQAISRNEVGVAARAILDTLKNPIKVVAQSGGRTKVIGKDAVVVINRGGKVITTWARNSVGRRTQ